MGTFKTRRTVAFGDCDPAGYIYTPRAGHFVVEAILEFQAAALGAPAARAILGIDVLPPTKSLSIEFASALTWDDTIELEVVCIEIGTTSFTSEVTARRESGEVAFRGGSRRFVCRPTASALSPSRMCFARRCEASSFELQSREPGVRMSKSSADDLVICSAIRTPVGKFMGTLSSVPAPALGSAAIRSAVTQARADPEWVDEVLMGCVLSANLGQAPARQASIGAGLSVATPATTVNKVCGSGLKAVMFAVDGLRLGATKVAVAGGMESMSGAPYLVPQARAGYKVGHAAFVDHLMKDGLEDAYESGRSMGAFGEETALAYGFSRAEQDAYATETVKRAQAAIAQGRFAAEIVPVTVGSGQTATEVAIDEIPGKISPEKIPGLRPAFRTNGTITAASSSANSDGAAALVLSTRAHAASLGLPILARVMAHATHARAPFEFTLAPIGAIQKVVDKVGWTLSDVDLFEINEAFAVVVMAAMRDLKLSHDRVNVNGGACALGHPIGASGARVLVTLLHALRARELRRGVATLCIGGGEAVALAVELSS